MNAYIYNADIYCEACGEAIRNEMANANHAPENWDDESSYDSGEFPKGPYPDGGGESDCPNHCGACGAFLENPLTTDGMNYVIESLQTEPSGELVNQWAEYYEVKR